MLDQRRVPDHLPSPDTVATAASGSLAPVMEPQRGKIVTRHLDLVYQLPGGARHQVLVDINLTVDDQELVCIIGPSGCGKTSILNVVAGFVAPSGGDVLLDDKPVGPPSTDRVVVFQEDAVFPWYTVRRNLEYGLRASGMSAPARRERVEGLLDMLGLTAFADAYPRQLSGGMRKRCDIGRALALHPEVLLMDEPFAALDVMTKERLQIEFQTLWTQQKMTALFITHDLEEALFLGDRVIIMSHNPGRFTAEVRVPFPRPRSAEIKTTPEFQQLRHELAGRLTAVVENAAAVS